MTHFSVLVKVDKDRLNHHEGDIEKAVKEILAPYQENCTKDCPKEFLVFHDKTKEIKEQWETGEESFARLPNGDLVFSWNDRTRNLQKKDIIELPLKEYYKSFDEYVSDWHGYKWDEEQQAWGYWENPNAKWDWWIIGGRWDCLFVLKNRAGRANIARVKDIDFDKMESKEPFTTWAVLDNDEWHEVAKMGWFALSDATEKESKDLEENYMDRFISNEDPETTLVIVDCHI